MNKTRSGYFFMLFVAGIYLSLGNLARIWPIPGLSDSIPATEFILYISAVIFSLWTRKFIGLLYRYRFYYLVIGLSTVYGILLEGSLDAVSVAYAIRLIMVIFSASTAGYALTFVSNYNIRYAAQYFLLVYGVAISLGFVIFFVFSDSVLLWVFLAKYGVVFSGDPHQNRFLSTYLDPNFYSAIAMIPILLSLYLYKVKKSYIYFGFLLVAVLSLFLSGSRSGVGCFVFIYIYLNIISFNFKKYSIEKDFFFINMLIILSLPIVFLISFDTVYVLFARTAGIQQDASAMVRLTSFTDGLSILEQYPFFGIGYNYLSLKMFAMRGLSSVDSSVLSTLINFGIVPTLAFIVFLFFKMKNFSNKINSLEKSCAIDRPAAYIMRAFLMYVLVCIIFASQFNNLIYYQYWLFPVVMLSEFFATILRRAVHESEKVRHMVTVPSPLGLR